MSFCDVKWLSFFQAPVPEVTSECDPWSPVSRFKLAAEHALADVAELDYVINCAGETKLGQSEQVSAHHVLLYF